LGFGFPVSGFGEYQTKNVEFLNAGAVSPTSAVQNSLFDTTPVKLEKCLLRL
jgi:hypothetical protein